MSDHPSAVTLPPGWDHILDDIQERLTHALQTTDAPIEPTPPEATEASAQRAHDWAALCERVTALASRAGQADALVRQVDLGLEAAELALQTHHASAAALQQRLAEWTERAIG